tara:strand:+ start:1062 stop:1247 length:186 start_codon:yes stop_codon:yes gene_type:complete
MSFTLCIRTLCSLSKEEEVKQDDKDFMEISTSNEGAPNILSMKGTFKDKTVENSMNNNQER